MDNACGRRVSGPSGRLPAVTSPPAGAPAGSPAGPPARVETERLLLTAPVEADLAELHALHADPGVWRHLPSGRHAGPEQTRALVDGYRADWAAHGLGPWTVRPRGGGPVLGMGGCSLRHGLAWNVYYRLAPAAWGRGYAQEVVAQARRWAARLRPELPVVAYLLEHNEGSRRAAERAGLVLVHRGPDAGNPDPAAVRLVYADRPVDAALLAAFTA